MGFLSEKGSQRPFLPLRIRGFVVAGPNPSILRIIATMKWRHDLGVLEHQCVTMFHEGRFPAKLFGESGRKNDSVVCSTFTQQHFSDSYTTSSPMSCWVVFWKQISSPPARWGSLHFNKVATPLPLFPPPSPPPLLLPACRHCGHRPTRISQQVQKLLANSSSVCTPGPYRELQLSLGTDPNICQTESECQNRSQIERHKRCQIECQSQCQKGCQNICHNICQLVEITSYHAARKKMPNMRVSSFHSTWPWIKSLASWWTST